MAEKKVTIMVLDVDLQHSKSYEKVRKLLYKFHEIRDQVYDEKANKVTIKVVSDSPEKIKYKLCCKGGGCIKSIEIIEPPPPKVTIMVLTVDLQCSKSYKKVRKLLYKFREIRDQVYDEKANKVAIKVASDSPEKITDKLLCKGGGCIRSIRIQPPPPEKPAEPCKPPPQQPTGPCKPPPPMRGPSGPLIERPRSPPRTDNERN